MRNPLTHLDRVAGVDEVGRGPLAGAVIAAAVILDPLKPIPFITDSKKLSEKQREKIAQQIRDLSISWAIGRAEVEEIDQLNILQASLLAMKRAVEKLSLMPELVLVDGNQCPRWIYSSQAIIKGDLTVRAIGAASIIAKVARDQEMMLLDEQYPGYGLAQHKGYPTKAHCLALKELGPSAIHRRSFAPVRALLENAL